MLKLECKYDTNNDGDCSLCTRCGGCPVGLFKKSEIDAAQMTAEEIQTFKRDAQWFDYTELLGTIQGYRHRDGRVLIEKSSLSKS